MATHRLIRRGLVAALLGLTALAATACSGKAAASSAGPDGKQLTTIRMPQTLSELAIVADKKGFFAEEGVKIEWTGQQAHGPANIVSIVAGQNDAAQSIDTGIIDANVKGGKIRAVAATGLSPLITWFVKKDSGITRPEDLLGKKVAGQSATITWYPLVKYLSDKGADYNRIEFVTVPIPQQEQALLSGQVAAIAVSEPFTSKIAASGEAVKLIDDYQVLGVKQIGAWAFSQEFIDKNPDAVRGFIKALLKTVAYIQASDADYKEAQKIAVDGGGRSLSRDWSTTLLLEQEDFDKWVSLEEKYNGLKPGSADTADQFTNEFNPNAK